MNARHRTAAADVLVPERSEAALILDEERHRTGNEIAAALAAMRLAAVAKGPATRERLIDNAIERLEGFGQVHRILSAKPPAIADASLAVEEMCRAVLAARHEVTEGEAVLKLQPVIADGPTIGRLSIIVHELLTNAVKHAFRFGGTMLTVQLENADGGVRLVVSDNGPGVEGPGGAGTGSGGSLLQTLVSRAGGTIRYRSSREGTEVSVTLPIDVALFAKNGNVRRGGPSRPAIRG